MVRVCFKNGGSVIISAVALGMVTPWGTTALVSGSACPLCWKPHWGQGCVRLTPGTSDVAGGRVGFEQGSKWSLLNGWEGKKSTAQPLWWELGSCPSYNPALRGSEFRSPSSSLEKKGPGPVEPIQMQELLCLAIDSGLINCYQPFPGPRRSKRTEYRADLCPASGTSILSASQAGSRVLSRPWRVLFDAVWAFRNRPHGLVLVVRIWVPRS